MIVEAVTIGMERDIEIVKGTCGSGSMGLRYAESEKRPVPGCYFAWAESTDRVKIGKAVTSKSRLASLQCGSPYELILLWCGPGVEQTLHHAFHRHRVRAKGEWFFATDSLIQFAASAPGWRNPDAIARLAVQAGTEQPTVVCACNGSGLSLEDRRFSRCPHHQNRERSRADADSCAYSNRLARSLCIGAQWEPSIFDGDEDEIRSRLP